MTEKDRFEDERFESLAAKLSTTFEQQGERFEPSTDAYARLAEAVNPPGRERPGSRWLRPLSVGVAAVAVLGIGGFFLSQQGVNSVDTGPGLDAAADDRSDTDRSSDEDSDDGGSGPDIDVANPEDQTNAAEESEDFSSDVLVEDCSPDAPVFGPAASTRLGAGQAFLDLLGFRFASVEEDGDLVVVRSFVDGVGLAEGEGRVVASLKVVEMVDGFAVIEASSDSVTISRIDTAAIAAGNLSITGEGTGFEGTLTVEVVGAGGRALVATSVQAGSLGEQGPYTVEVPVVGSERAWVVVGSSGGASGVTDPFAALPISYCSTGDRTKYSVVGVDLDDVDGGLKVRRGPGVTNESFTVLEPGANGIRRAGLFPVTVGDDEWWAIFATSGEVGWVNSRFLASGEAVDSDQMDRIADNARVILGGLGEQAGPSSPGEPGINLPFSDRLPVTIGWVGAVSTEAGARLQNAEAWRLERSFELPADYGDPFVGSMAEFYRLDAWSGASISPGGLFTYESDGEAADTYFGGLSSVVIEADNPAGPWDRTHIYFEQTPTGPRVVGLVLEVMQP